ncbi:MAG: hypothetical protein ABI693_23925 [Bryobacteraceae bacterium]
MSGTRFADVAITDAPRAFDLGLVTHPAALDANYVRRSSAELLWKDRCVGSM